LTRSIWNKKQYNYLSLADSRLYDRVKNSDDPKDKEIKRLLLEKAAESIALARIEDAMPCTNSF